MVILLFFVVSCMDESIPLKPNEALSSLPNARVAGSFFEDFESGSKTAYEAANITLSTGSWYLADALIGSSTSDQKTGTKSVRVRNSGVIRMNFNLSTGASVVNVKHAKYGSDGTSSWELWQSTDGGLVYNKVGETVTTSSSTLDEVSFEVHVPGTITFEIRKISGGSYRINIDDFEVVPYVEPAPEPEPIAEDDNMAFGNPSGATADVSNENNYLMDKNYYVMSYNRSRATPNWVSWYVGPSTIGNAPRQDNFRGDTELPTGWYKVTSTSYTGSGFDRGHNCPSADRSATVEANASTFLMTNMIPQAPINNQQTWANLENYTRTLINNGNEVYVIMGSYGVGGKGSKGNANTIDNGRVTVPNRIWKVMVVIPQGTNDVARVTTSTRVIAIDTPNSNSMSTAWGYYRTSVDTIEAATGYDLLSVLPDDIEAVLEARVDNGPTN
jgi:endonuclease G, mitochondrial